MLKKLFQEIFKKGSISYGTIDIRQYNTVLSIRRQYMIPLALIKLGHLD